MEDIRKGALIQVILGSGLHCGECLQVLMDGKWMQTRMEMDAERNWYLVGTPYRGDLEYIRARI